ncbi:hypothetical protein BBK82_31065 [Lentzea guizhouensis]|uniref:PAS domain S-box protein n=1 Tax=Lentzea guizhouensis TaxID=1586287 RepID=A0A1B2HQ38_9PSEU|nr:SpoIIE family protein phosphatase [Lentzea guizhouensis]ANZ39827.1 hypothetical protein BBK82_31065 [Lentzea guizhouensis]
MDKPDDLLNAIAAVVYQADAGSGVVSSISAYAERMFGHPLHWWHGRADAWRSVVHPQDLAAVERDRARGAGERDEFDLTYRIVDAGGRVLWVQDRIVVQRSAEGAPLWLRGVLTDVTRHIADREREQFLTLLDHELQRTSDAESVMAAATRMLGEHLRADRCAYAQVEQDENHFVMSGDHATGLPPLAGRFAMSAFGEPAVAAMRAGSPWIVGDSAADPRLGTADQAVYEATGIRAVVCLPLMRDGRFVAGMAVHQATARQWSAPEIELVSVVVNRCWESLQRVHADRQLRDSELRYRQLVESTTDAILMLDADLRFIDANPALCTLLGRDRNELVGTAAADVLDHGEHSRLRELVDDTASPRSITAVWHLLRADDTRVAVELSIQTTSRGVQAIGRDITERLRAEAERDLLLRREHEIAETLQRSLLPRELPPLERLAVSARYLPAGYGQIGGDWYDVLHLGKTTVALTVGDVVGKGAAAAAVMGQLRSALSGYLVDGHPPAAALERLDAFAARIEGAAGSSCACATFDWATGTLCWSTAGHPPPVVVDDTTAQTLTGHGAVLGVSKREPYRDQQTTLRPGASILLYTDGLVEHRERPIDQGLHALTNVVSPAHEQNPTSLANTVIDALLTDGQHDDVALVIARHLPPPLRQRLPARPGELAGMRKRIRTWSQQSGLSPDAGYDLQLALGEAVANAVDHAYPDEPGDLEYSVRHTATAIEVTVSDEGRWRPPTPGPTNRGRGIKLIQTLSTTMDLRHDANGTTVTFQLACTTRNDTAAEHPSPSPSSPPEADTADHGNTAVAPVQHLALDEDLDSATIPRIRQTLLTQITTSDPRPVNVDLTAVRYISSSGIALLIEAMTAAHDRGRALTVTTAPGSAPARILALSGLA